MLASLKSQCVRSSEQTNEVVRHTKRFVQLPGTLYVDTA